MSYLQVVVVDSQLRQADFGVGTDADQIRGIELHFSAGAGARRNPIFHHEGRVDHRRHPVAGISPTDRYFAAGNADASHSPLRSSDILDRSGILGVQNGGSHHQKGSRCEESGRAGVSWHILLRLPCAKQLRVHNSIPGDSETYVIWRPGAGWLKTTSVIGKQQLW